MSIAIDIILALITAVPIILGIKRGLIRSVMGLVTVIVSIVAANLLMPYVSPVCSERLVEPYLAGPMEEYIGTLMEDGSEAVAQSGEQLLSGIPETVTRLCESIGIDPAELIKTEMIETSSVTVPVTAVAKSITESVTDKAADVIAFAAVFFTALILFKLVTLLLNEIFKLPMLSGINKLTGALFGLICGGAMAFVIGKLMIVMMPALISANAVLFEGACESSLFLSMISGL